MLFHAICVRLLIYFDYLPVGNEIFEFRPIDRDIIFLLLLLIPYI